MADHDLVRNNDTNDDRAISRHSGRGRSGRGEAGLEVAARTNPDVVIVDAAPAMCCYPRGVTKRLVAEFAVRAKGPISMPALELLTDREREVMTLVAGGLSNDEIAERLVVSPATAKTHVSRAMVKLGARDRAPLVAFAYESDLPPAGSCRPVPRRT
jgi:DNA-binding CsgD family transcriptional regulator